jgi:hypothetical protein
MRRIDYCQGNKFAVEYEGIRTHLATDVEVEMKG